ncbi:MAG TPA: M48 family metallopeptidase [Candidatus Nanopelagicaceae bacterium]
MESVENFRQQSLFGDSLPAVTPDPQKSEKFQRSKPLPDNLPEFRVIRSTRRKRSISATRQNGIIEIHIPDRMSRKDEAAIIPEMIEIVLRREAKNRSSDLALRQMAAALFERYLPDFDERPTAITWRTMRERWGSCTTSDRTVRISLRLNGAPDYVVGCVLFHELIHLRVPGHGVDFQAYLERYPDKDRAEAFLEGFEAGLSAMPEEILHEQLQ